MPDLNTRIATRISIHYLTHIHYSRRKRAHRDYARTVVSSTVWVPAEGGGVLSALRASLSVLRTFAWLKCTEEGAGLYCLLLFSSCLARAVTQFAWAGDSCKGNPRTPSGYPLGQTFEFEVFLFVKGSSTFKSGTMGPCIHRQYSGAVFLLKNENSA